MYGTDQVNVHPNTDSTAVQVPTTAQYINHLSIWISPSGLDTGVDNALYDAYAGYNRQQILLNFIQYLLSSQSLIDLQEREIKSKDYDN